MITEYREIPQEEVDRSGKVYLSCDAEGCTAEAEVENVQRYELMNGPYAEAPMPEGWVTSDPENNAMAGGAQFCPAHADLYVEPGSIPVEAEPSVVSDSGTVEATGTNP